MWLKEELIKKQKLTILVIITVIFAMIFLGPSQALSKRPPWRPNYYATVTGVIEGEGEVKMQRGSVHSGLGDIFPLRFYISGFEGDHHGWIDININNRSGMGQFYCSWSEDGSDYSLNGLGTFEYNKKEDWFRFISVGTYYITKWSIPTPETLLEGDLEFEIYGTPLDQ